MKTATFSLTPRVTEVLVETKRFTETEKLILAKLLLESLLADEMDEETDWRKMSLKSFQKDWDNAEDSIYDDWRDKYGLPKR